VKNSNSSTNSHHDMHISPPQVMEEWMGRAVALLQNASEVLLLEVVNSPSGLLSHTRVRGMEPAVFFIQLAIQNNLAHLNSHFMCVEHVRQCLIFMRQILNQYRSSLLTSHHVRTTAMQLLDHDTIVFEMNLFLLCDGHALVLAPAA
jgi:hypothetical protein